MRKAILTSMVLAAILGFSTVALADGEGAGDGLRPAPAKSTGPKTPSAAPTVAPADGQQKDAKAPGTVKKNKGPGGLFGGSGMIFIMLGGFVLLMFLMGRGNKKREAQRKQMLANLKKGDKVSTIGGIVGTVVDLREDEVVLKVDENNNIRMKFLRRAISGIGGAKDATLGDKK